jgi:hypothetical protein
VSTRLIYPARRAVEHAVTEPEVRPLRLFAVLWPLWQVETAANIYDEQSYDVVDRFLVRAVAEAGLSRTVDLVAFLGLPEPLVRRCLRFLSVIGHAQVDGAGTVRLTELGLRSAREGVRHVPRESRQDILVERFTSRPLPRRHYEGSVEVLPSPKVDEERLGDRTRFRYLHAQAAFRPEIVQQLAQRPDRAEFNLPRQLRDLRVIQDEHAYLPGYVIETVGSGLLAYTAVAPERDPFFEAVCREVPRVHQLVDAEERGNPRAIWADWLADPKALRRGTLRQLPNGVWRATLHPDSFGSRPKLPLTRVGSFELRRHHFLQVWCEGAGLRRRAAQERALGLAQTRDVRTRADLDQRVAELAGRLEVRPPSAMELRVYGEKHGLHAQVARLDQLE